ncbi:MAG TPA: NACHT domain-containing protein, partial [Arcobacter sp.]|nr:NACHT domain-containing protein [Arcobacter sp.]
MSNQNHSGSGDNIAGDKHEHYYHNGSKTINKEELKKSCTEHYLQNFKTISLLIEDDKKPIDDIYVNLAIIKEEKEKDIKDPSKLLDRDKIINSYEEIYKPKEPIAIEKLIEKSSKFNSAKALIYGKAGIGKTTFCKHIAYRWAKGELYSEFDNIVYIALREWKEDGLESIIKKIYFEEKHQNEAIEIDQSKTLFLFDGYDELSETSLLHGAIKKYNLQNYIITSRPYGYRKSDFDVNEVFETIGFTDENVTAYIDKFFQEQKHKTNLQNFLKQNINIRHIAYIPLMLEMICSLWREKAKNNQSFLSPMTMTELYSEVIEYVFFEYSETNNTAYIQEREDEIFNYLGKIAFEGLKRQVIVLDKSIIKEKKEFFVDYVLKTGFLKSDRKHRNPLMNSYQFPHLTFQECFSALYVSKLSKEEISEVIREYKFYPYMQVFFAFLGGLIDDKEWFLLEIESEPKDLAGFYQILFTINCLSEIHIGSLINSSIETKINQEITYWIELLCDDKNRIGNSNLYIQFRNFFDRLKNIPLWLNKSTSDSIIKVIEDIHNEFNIPMRERLVEDYFIYFIKNNNFIEISILDKLLNN